MNIRPNEGYDKLLKIPIYVTPLQDEYEYEFDDEQFCKPTKRDQ